MVTRICPGWNPAQPHVEPLLLDYDTPTKGEPEVSICHVCMVHMIQEIGKYTLLIEAGDYRWLLEELGYARPAGQV